MGNIPPIPRLGVPPLKLHDAGNGCLMFALGSQFSVVTGFPVLNVASARGVHVCSFSRAI